MLKVLHGIVIQLLRYDRFYLSYYRLETCNRIAVLDFDDLVLLSSDTKK